MRYKTLIAIPVFNESDLRNVIHGVKKFALDILVIDDGSTDGVSENLTGLGKIHVIIHPRNLGYGKTILDSFTYAIENGYDYLLTIDSDGQHDPEEISLFLKEIPFYNYDILSGSRYYFPIKAGKEVPQERYIINKEITGIVNRVTGFNLTDAFCGFKAYKVDKLKTMHLTECGYGMPLQLWIQAWKMGLRVREIPVKLIYKDLTRRFKGVMEDPDTRLCYYKEVIEEALANTEQNNVANLRIKRRRRY